MLTLDIYTTFEHDLGWPFPGEHVYPRLVTPDGKLWLMYDSEYPSTEAGLCWYDGVNVGMIPASPGGVPQWGGLPNSNIRELEYKAVAGGYELWMSCKGRGIAVLKYLQSNPITTFQLTVSVANGWNMVSIPGLNTPDQNVNTWWAFRDLGANVFKICWWISTSNRSQYLEQDTG